MAFPGARGEARRLQALLHDQLGRDAAQVRPYGQHLVIDMVTDDGRYAVARLTRVEQDRYGLSFRRHTGRWEPMPVEGSLEKVVSGALTLLAPYLDPRNY